MKNTVRVDLREPNDKLYKITKFPDNSLKFTLDENVDTYAEKVVVRTTLRNSDDIFLLALVKDVIDRGFKGAETYLNITYLMYQQGDRLFQPNESFGLKVLSRFINDMKWDYVTVFHPHSDKVEFIDNCVIIDNTALVKTIIDTLNNEEAIWVIPDSGAFKTQFKQIQKLNHKNFITCMKSRNHTTGEIETVVNAYDLTGKECFIVDDICLGGRTFIQIAKKTDKNNSYFVDFQCHDFSMRGMDSQDAVMASGLGHLAVSKRPKAFFIHMFFFF